MSLRFGLITAGRFSSAESTVRIRHRRRPKEHKRLCNMMTLGFMVGQTGLFYEEAFLEFSSY